MDQQLVTRIVEAALLAAHQPLTLAQLGALFPEDQPAPADSIGQALETLQADCAERGVELVELASGFRYQVKGDVHPWVTRLWTERQTRYTRATLETLALIAYRQPITRGEIEQVRGVAVNSNIIRALEEREWIRVVGHRDVPGKPALFGTTRTFLDYFGLKRLDELPPLSELKDIGELDPQFKFDEREAATTPAGNEAIAAGGIGSGAMDEAGDDAGNDADDGSQADHGNDTEIDTNTHADSIDTDAAGDTQDDAPQSAEGTTDEGKPEAAPGERVADENEMLSEHEQDHAVETTTVPELQAASDDEDGRSNHQ
jgi:segregation and condensation protein B